MKDFVTRRLPHWTIWKTKRGHSRTDTIPTAGQTSAYEHGSNNTPTASVLGEQVSSGGLRPSRLEKGLILCLLQDLPPGESLVHWKLLWSPPLYLPPLHTTTPPHMAWCPIPWGQGLKSNIVINPSFNIGQGPTHRQISASDP